MRARTAWLGALGVAGAAVWRSLLRRPTHHPTPPPGPDPRADELRRRLDESREIVDERDEFESAETPGDQAQPGDVGARRDAVHERARAAAEEMRRNPPG